MSTYQGSLIHEDYHQLVDKKYILSKDGVKLTLVVNSPITKSSILKTNFSDKGSVSSRYVPQNPPMMI